MHPARVAHYTHLTQRFELRAAGLLDLGFVRRDIPELDTACFERPSPTSPGRTQRVMATTVMHADDIVWADELETLGPPPPDGRTVVVTVPVR